MSDQTLMAPAPHASRTAYANAVRRLNGRERAFVLAYLDGRNATRAYMAAYPGCKKSSAEAKAYGYLEKVGVREALLAFDAMMGEKLAVTKERWLREMAVIAFADPRWFGRGHDGRPALRADLPEEFGRCLTMKVKHHEGPDGRTVGVTTEYSFESKTKALIAIGTHLGFFREYRSDTNVNVEFTIEDVAAAHRKAVELGLVPPLNMPKPRPKEIGG